MGVKIKGHCGQAYYKWSGKKVEREPIETGESRRKAAWKVAKETPAPVRRKSRKDKASKVLNMPGPKSRNVDNG